MNRCTWRGKNKDRCTEIGTHPQTGQGGAVWANLCDEHHNKLEDAINNGDVRLMVGYWVAASGGPKKMAESM